MLHGIGSQCLGPLHASELCNILYIMLEVLGVVLIVFSVMKALEPFFTHPQKIDILS
jgi:hypothetical protein